MMHSSTVLGSRLARFTASRTTRAPSCGAVRSDRLPWDFPMGVRQPEMITTSSKAAITVLLKRFRTFHYRCVEEEKSESRWTHRPRSVHRIARDQSTREV